MFGLKPQAVHQGHSHQTDRDLNDQLQKIPIARHPSLQVTELSKFFWLHSASEQS